MKTKTFEYSYRFAGLTDIGLRRNSNQDEIILCPEYNFFAVSDGMGGLKYGGETSAYVKEAIPKIFDTYYSKELQSGDVKTITESLLDSVQLISDQLFLQVNQSDYFQYGATLAGVFLHGKKAFFVCLGDSRGYSIPKHKKKPIQITEDMNVAGLLIKNGELTKEEAAENEASSRLTAFVGMPSPATPEVYVAEVMPGDRLLLCSDGLYGMVSEREMAQIMRSSKNPDKICHRMVDRANQNGGRDNISVVYIKIS